MPAPQEPTKPPNVVRNVTFLCGRRVSEQVVSLRCTACGWHGRPDPEADAGGDAPLTLFPEPGTEPHTEQECARRQLDPWFRYEQDSRYLADAGLPDVLAPPTTPRPDPTGP